MVTRDEAIAAGESWGRVEFWHLRMKNRDGTPLRARTNGKCKTWKSEPERFSLPIKHGLRDCGYLTERNADEWITASEGERRQAPALALDTPEGIVADLEIDRGIRSA